MPQIPDTGRRAPARRAQDDGPAAPLRSRASANRRFILALGAVCVLWLALRAIGFNGYYTEDSPGYVTDAIYAALGNYHARNDVNGLNVGTYLPVALPLAVLGKSELALALWPLFCSLLGLVALAGSAAILFGRPFGLLAALLFATYPGDIFFSTVVMPDAIQAGWLAFAVFLVVSADARPSAAGRSASRRSAAEGPGTEGADTEGAGTKGAREWKLAAAGIGMGVCHLVRANGPILVPIGLVAIIALGWKRKGEGIRSVVRGCVAYLAGWLAVQAVEGAVYFWATGDFFHRFHVVNRHYGTIASIAKWGLNTSWSTIPSTIFPPVLWWRIGGWGALNQDQAYHGFIFCLALSGLVLAALAWGGTRTRVALPKGTGAGLALAAFWVAWPLLYHQFGSQSLTHFVPIHRLSRHLVLYAPGAVFATVAACAVIWRAASGSPAAVRGGLAAVGVLVLAVHLEANWEAERIAHESYHRIKRTYVRIREHLPAGVRTIVADPGDLGFFDFWLNPLGVERVRLVPFANFADCGRLPAGVVLTRSNPGWEGLSAQAIQDTVRRLPCLLQPPASWKLLYDGWPEKIFVVDDAAMR